jgi:hypothetical protein
MAGPAGPQGERGLQGDPGQRGLFGQTGASAYELAVSHGFQGNESQWISSLTPISNIPAGGIIMWDGPVQSIPVGWLLHGQQADICYIKKTA